MRDRKRDEIEVGRIRTRRVAPAACLIAVLVWTLLGLPGSVMAGHDGLGGIALIPARSVRSIAMGETGLMETGNTLGFGLNPAGLPFLDASGVAIGYGLQDKALSVNQSNLAGVMTIGRGYDVPGIARAGKRFGVGFEFDHSELKLSQGSIWATETLAAGAGYRVLPYASLGILIKTLFNNTDIEGAGASAFGVDLTTLLEFRPDLSLAFAVRNLGGKASWEAGEEESLPLLFSLGGHVLLPGRISADLTVGISGSDQTKGGIGFELPLPETSICLRGGYSYQGGSYTRNIPTFGFGVGFQGFQIDYAARFDDELALGTTHHFALSYRFESGR